MIFGGLAVPSSTLFWSRYIVLWNTGRITDSVMNATGTANFPSTLQDLEAWSDNQAYQIPASPVEEELGEEVPVETDPKKRLVAVESSVTQLEEVTLAQRDYIKKVLEYKK